MRGRLQPAWLDRPNRRTRPERRIPLNTNELGSPVFVQVVDRAHRFVFGLAHAMVLPAAFDYLNIDEPLVFDLNDLGLIGHGLLPHGQSCYSFAPSVF